MRVEEQPNLPLPASGAFLPTLIGYLGRVARQLNGISEGRLAAVTNSGTAAPTGGTNYQGDKVWNSAPTELGGAGSRYCIVGWICVASGSPGTWKEMRTLTGA
jgi:hypothetical protein